MKKLLLSLLLISSACSAQEMFGIANSNYAGLNGLNLNPSSIVDSRLGLDINLITIATTVDNNYLYIPTNDLSFFGFGKINDDIKNKLYTDAKNYPGDENKNLNMSTFLRGPSVMFHIDKNWFALSLNFREALDMSDINYSVAKFGFEDQHLHYAPLQGNLLNSGAFSIGSMVWSEIGFTYGREILNSSKNYLKGAITVKRLNGYAAIYARTDNFTYQVDSNVINFNNVNLQYGHSYTDFKTTDYINHTNNGSGWGFDIGFAYEYRPDDERHTYEMDGKTLEDPKQNQYKWRVGLSIIDIGKISFDQNAQALDIAGRNGSWVGWDTVNIKGVGNLDSTLSNVFYNQPAASNNGLHKFDMALPHALSLQFDYHLAKHFYANASWIQKIDASGLGVVATNNIAVTPRLETKGIEVAVPLSYSLNQFRLGLALRLGSIFIIGSDKLSSLMGVSDLGGMDAYMSLKIPIGRKRIKDKDADGVSDRMDLCPDQKGSWTALGCPDRDGDGIADKDDECPDVPGVALFKGCPDTDGDGIPDKDDACPTVPGLAEFKGCPDTDGDGIPDPEDSCPTVKGLIQFHGCPDTDGDGIPDQQDSCPTVKGLAQFHGCPDTDGDGIPDQLDSCPNEKGPASNHGCPVIQKVEIKQEPVKAAVLTKEEQEVISKVFRNLEFETGKSVIRQSSYASLNDLADLLKKKPSFKLHIDGHTDNVGGAAMNLKLSNNRAGAVKLYLTEKGIDAARITATGYGMTKPIASNKTAEGRQKNRRVEFTIVE